MPNWHDDDCDCAECLAHEDRFWREQGEGGDRQMPPDDEFDVSDTDVEGPCSHVFNGDRCDRCGADYNPLVHGHRVIPKDDLSW